MNIPNHTNSGVHTSTYLARSELYQAVSTRDGFYRIVLIITLLLSTTYLLLPTSYLGRHSYKVGDLAKENIKADAPYTIIDENATRLLQDEAIKQIPTVYDYDPTVMQATVEKLEAFFTALNRYQSQPTLITEISTEALNADLQANFTSDTLRQFSKLNRLNLLKTVLISLVREQMNRRYLVDTLENLPVITGSAIEINSIEPSETPKTPILLDDLKAVSDLQRLRQDLPALLTSHRRLGESQGITSMHLELANQLMQQLLRPNLTFNSQATEANKRTASRDLQPVMITLQKGETILTEGERVTARKNLILESIRKEKSQRRSFSTFLSRLLLITLFLTGTVIAGRRFLRDFNPTTRDLGLLTALILFSLIVFRFGALFFDQIGLAVPAVTPRMFHYMLPFAAGAMAVRMVLNGSCTVIYTLAQALLTAMLFGFDFQIGAFVLLSSIVGAFIVEKSQTRTRLFKAALMVSLFNLLLVGSYEWISSPATALHQMFISSFILLVLTTLSLFLMLSLIIPVIEYFDYVTDMKLIELANFNNPLLNRLALEAPGTYHHSRVVAQLVEAAAAGIGANALLAMVSALYHDIGKTKAPQYFTENQSEETRNIHDRLKPSMSKMIIISHIKDGIEMAKKAGLPAAIIRGIPEHHGTSLITFFYHKAKDQEDPDLDPIDENEYRYPGPKPQSKETALLLLADSVEAATKSLSDPTPEKIQTIIQKIFNKYFSDAQLNECDLTLKDLNKIAKSFHRTLTSVYKPRIEYPEVVPSSGGTQKAKKDAGRNQQSTKKADGTPTDSEDEDAENLKRLGL